jgi:hypothetical protein
MLTHSPSRDERQTNLDRTIKEARMSFLIDPPWLYATGRIYGRVMPQPSRTSRAVSVATAGLFLTTSVSLYLEHRWTEPIWRACRAESGRDWMLNSGVFRFDPNNARIGTHRVAAAIFATYPLWLAMGIRHARRRSLSGAGVEPHEVSTE